MTAANEISHERLTALKNMGLVMTALGSVTRQRILMLLQEKQAIPTNEIADHFNLSRTAVVHHLGVLRDAGVVKPNGSEETIWVDWKLIADTLGTAHAWVAPLAEAQ